MAWLTALDEVPGHAFGDFALSNADDMWEDWQSRHLPQNNSGAWLVALAKTRSNTQAWNAFCADRQRWAAVPDGSTWYTAGYPIAEVEELLRSSTHSEFAAHTRRAATVAALLRPA